MDNTNISPDINQAQSNQIENFPELNGALIFPSLVHRVKALVVDWIIILIIFTVSSLVINEFQDTPNWIRGGILIFSLYLYEPTLIFYLGGTVGHKLTGLQVKKISSPNKNLNFLESSMRFVIKYLLGWISFLTITGNKRKRAVHDMVSGSIVLFKNHH